MINWREYPFVRTLLPFSGGILLAMYGKFMLPAAYLILVLLGIAWIILGLVKLPFSRRWWSGIIHHLFFFLFGYLICWQHGAEHQSHYLGRVGELEQLLIGTVLNTPSKSLRSIQVELRGEQQKVAGGNWAKVSGKLLLYFQNDTLSQSIRYGDRLLLQLQPQATPSPLNPDAFDYRQYLARKNIHLQAYVRSGHWTRLDRDQGNPLLAWAYQQRTKGLAILKKRLPKAEQYAVASAMILGYKEALSEKVKTAYSSTGAMHVLAVSGLHVGLIWMILAFLLSWIRSVHPVWRWGKTVIIILGLWLFALLTGGSPSVLRAAAMFSLILVGRTLRRSSSIYNTLAVSAFFILCFNPYLLLDVGFQLSYTAVLGIVYFYPKIYPWWYIENRLGDYIWKLTSVAIAAQLSTMPLTLFYFHQFPLYFWLSGLVVIPFASVIISCGIALLLAEACLPVLASLFGQVLNGIVWLMNALIFVLDQLPKGILDSVWIGGFTLILLYLIIGNVIIGIQTRRLRWYLIGMVGVFALAVQFNIIRFQQYRQRELVLYHLKGATYVESLDGRKAISLASRDLDPAQVKYATQNYHRRRGIINRELYHFGETIQTGHWYLEKQFIQFYDQRIAWVDQLPDKVGAHKIEVDYLLLRDRFRGKLSSVVQHFKTDWIVFDGTHPAWKVERWKAECEQLNIPYYDLRESGALIVKL